MCGFELVPDGEPPLQPPALAQAAPWLNELVGLANNMSESPAVLRAGDWCDLDVLVHGWFMSASCQP